MNRVIYILEKPRAKVTIYLVIIVGVTFAIYYPSFVHQLRGETYSYFLETLGEHSAFSLIKNFYNYEMVRVFNAGDSLAFRPLLFVVMGMEKALLGTDYTLWRVSAFIFHLATTLCLFRLMWKIRPSIIAVLATILFSTTFVIMNTVLYTNTSAYLLAATLMLITLYYVHCGIKSGKTKHLVLATISLLLACYMIELGMILGLLLIGYFWFERKQVNFNWKKWATVFIVIFIIYVTTYILETFVNPTSTTISDVSAMLSLHSFQAVWSNLGKLLEYWATQLMLPAIYTAKIDTLLQPNSVNISQVLPIIPIIFNSIAVLIIGASVFLRDRISKKQISFSFLTLLAFTPLAFVFANALFRGKMSGVRYSLSDGNHSVYIWAGLFILAIYACISFKKLAIKHKGLISMAFIILISLSAPVTFKLNQEIKTVEEPIRAYFQEIDSFLQGRRPEDDLDFSFNSITDDSVIENKLRIIMWKGAWATPERTRYEFSRPEVLYWNHWSNDNPKYSLIYHVEAERLEVILNE